MMICGRVRVVDSENVHNWVMANSNQYIRDAMFTEAL